MALKINREIPLKNFEEFVEHVTGKKILSWRKCPSRFGTEVYFTDETMTIVDAGYEFDYSNIEYKEIPKSICTSCGEEAHASFWGLHGCSNKAKLFWKKVRRVYWHRYIKNK